MLLLFILMINIKHCYAIHTQHVFYWPMWPYIRELNKTAYSAEGIIPEVLEKSFAQCKREEVFQFKYHNSFANYAEYVSFIKSNFTRGQDLLHEVSTNTSKDYLWFGPFISPEISSITHSWVSDMMRTVDAPGTHVIVDRYYVSWRRKIYIGIKNSLNYMILALLMSVCIGTLVFLIESHSEDTEFGNNIPEGIWNGFWWSTVTMTTVGYGDIVPKSILGRTLGIIWLILGIMIGSVILATVTDSIFSSDDLKIYKKKVAVLANSWEERFAKGHKADITALNSYDAVIQAVRDGEVFAALINSDVVQYKEKDITSNENPLAIVAHHPTKIPVKVNRQVEEDHSFYDCVEKHRAEIFETSQHKYFLHVNVERIHNVTLEEILIDDWFGLVLLILTVITILVTLIFLLIEKCIIKRKLYLHDMASVFRKRDEEETPEIKFNLEPSNGEEVLYNPYYRRHSRIPFDALRKRNSSFGVNSLDSNALDLRVENMEKKLTEISKMLQNLFENEKPNHQKKLEQINEQEIDEDLRY